MTSANNITLIVGLGNPGPSYEKTRHNAGAWFVEQIAAHHHATFKAEKKFFGDYAKVKLEQHELHLLKPTTYMNNSGQAVSALMKFYKIDAANLLVAHDEIDLPPGAIKLKLAGGHGGHNGLRDIFKAIDTKDFLRLRIGVGKADHKSEVADFVLKAPTKNEQQLIDTAVDDAERILPELIDGNIEKAMLRLHS